MQFCTNEDQRRTFSFRHRPRGPSTQSRQGGAGGKTQEEAARLFGVTRQTVGKWVKAYREGGSRNLQAGGRPQGGSLEPREAAQIIRAITDHHPDQLKLPFYLWTREAVGVLIEQRFGTSLSVWTVGRYLKEWGFTPQKPLRRAFEQDPVAVQRWIDEEYPLIRAQAKKAKAEIYWGDDGNAFGPPSRHHVRSQGQNPGHSRHGAAISL